MSAAFCPCRYRDETRTAKASDIFMYALLCEGAGSALERCEHALQDVRLTACI